MKAITKGPEPNSLTQHRSDLHTNYDNYTGKDDLRRALVHEQRGLCCYCMGRIRADAGSMKIEHWKCQVGHPNEQLKYRNILGACLGGEGSSYRFQHCDTRKADLDLMWNPADPAHVIETRVMYGSNGTIYSSDTTFDNQLNTVLNLNLRFLMNNRKGVLTAVLQWWAHEKRRLAGLPPRESIQRKIGRYTGGSEDLEPYCQVAVWWLRKKL